MKILVASQIDLDAIQKLQEQHHVICSYGAAEVELQTLIKDREILIFRSGVKITAEVMKCAPGLKLLIRAGSGTDNLDLDYVLQKGITFERTPGPSARSVAEMAFALIFALNRNLLKADHTMRQARWAKNELMGYLINKKLLGIVGVGNIGTRVGMFGVALGMNVIGCVEHPSEERAIGFKNLGIRLTNFIEVISTADIVSIHVPLKESTRYMFNKDTLSNMKPGSILINLARGGVVNEHDLYQSLHNEGRLRAAALDVHEQEGEGRRSPLADLPNVILTPHIGAMTFDSQQEIGSRIVEIVNKFVSNNC